MERGWEVSPSQSGTTNRSNQTEAATGSKWSKRLNLKVPPLWTLTRRCHQGCADLPLLPPRFRITLLQQQPKKPRRDTVNAQFQVKPSKLFEQVSLPTSSTSGEILPASQVMWDFAVCFISAAKHVKKYESFPSPKLCPSLHSDRISTQWSHKRKLPGIRPEGRRTATEVANEWNKPFPASA